MGKIVSLEIGDGDFERGFPLKLRVAEEGNSTVAEISGRLPPAPTIPEQYESWNTNYRDRDLGSVRKLEPVLGQTTNLSIIDSADLLQNSLNEWLNSNDKQFLPIRDRLLETLSQNRGDIRLFVQTDNIKLWQLPWELWDVLDDRYQVEPSFNRLTYEKRKPLPKRLNSQVRILVILGDSTDIDVEADLKLLQDGLPDAYIHPIVVNRQAQLSDQLWEQNWDILFFAGHSSSDSGYGKGKFYINETESITIEDLKHGLDNAINCGLCLTIFNSCDGLGLARDLASLQMPAIIVMRERIPDEAAQKFLEYFLKAFAEDKQSLRDSLREAKKRLKESVEERYPCVSWLPVLFESPVEVPPTWEGLRQRHEEKRQRVSIWQSLKTLLVASVAVTISVMAARSLGWLQKAEFQVFDRMLQMRADEGEDPRLLIVTLTEPDIQKLKQYPLQDRTIKQLLKKLEEYQPRVIGLDILRDIPQGPNRAEFIKYLDRLQQSDRFISVCEVGGSKDKPGIPPPEGIRISSLGFSDVLRDFDGIIRREILAMAPGSSPCQTDKSFSLQVARRYLEKEGFKLKLTTEEYFNIGKVVFKTLEKNSGGYHDLDARGHQILLNYRASAQIAQQITVTEVLNGAIAPDLVRDRIVLIGVTAKSGDVYFPTPYSASQSPIQEMPGVILRGQMVSQILSAVLDDRPLIEVWSKWGEGLWIWLWALAGGVMALYLRSPLHLALFGGTALGGMYSMGLVFLTQGSWVPIVPSALAFIISSSSVKILLRVGISGVILLFTLSGTCFLLLINGVWVPFVPAILSLVATGGIITVCLTDRVPQKKLKIKKISEKL